MKNKGFTLIELMIVVAIIMILGSGTLFGLRVRHKNNELISLRNEIPTQMETVTLKAYEVGRAGSIEVSTTTIKLSLAGSSDIEIKPDFYKFVASTTSAININTLGAFEKSFTIEVQDKSTSEKKFEVKVSSNLAHLGVSSIKVE